MDNGNFVTLLDEFGKEVQARIINIVEVDGQDYLLYSVELNDDEENVYVNKVVRDENGNEEYVAIMDEDEREYVFNALEEMINDIVQVIV